MMDWTNSQIVTTMTGLDIVLWFGAYMAWRAFSAARSAQKAHAAAGNAAVTQTVVVRPVSVRRPAPVVQRVDRWANRAQRLEKMKRPVGRRHAPKRKMRLAA